MTREALLLQVAQVRLERLDEELVRAGTGGAFVASAKPQTGTLTQCETKVSLPAVPASPADADSPLVHARELCGLLSLRRKLLWRRAAAP